MKLFHYGFSVNALSWIKDYFKSRKQRVVSNGMVSNWGSINCGVPQGSILGPLLFNIYVNDLSNAVTESCLHLFADDTTLYHSASSDVDVNSILNADLCKISLWMRSNLLKLNSKKTTSMLTGTKPFLRGKSLDLKLDDVSLQTVTQAKLFGVIIDENLT